MVKRFSALESIDEKSIIPSLIFKDLKFIDNKNRTFKMVDIR